MKRYVTVLGFVLLVAAPLLAAPSSDLEREARELEAMLVAPCCWSQQVSVHQSEAASQIKAEVRQALAAGRTRQEILDAYVAQYGMRILIQPPAKGFNASLYVLPVVALVFSAGGVALVVRRLTRHPAAADEPNAPGAVDDEREAQLDDELEQLD